MTQVWDSPASWHNTVSFTYEFKTQVIVSENGGEQRRAFRETPRVTVGQSFVMRADAFRKFSRLVGKSQQDQIRWSDPVHYVEAEATLAGAGTIPLAGAAPTWLTVDSFVALAWDRDIQFHQVSGVGSGSIVLAGTTNRNWPEGTQVRQTYLGFLPTDMQSTRLTDDVITLSIDFEALPMTTAPPDDSGPVGTGAASLGMLLSITTTGLIPTFNDRDILLLKPNWAVQPSWNDKREVNDIDWGYGRIVRMTPIGYQTRVSNWTYLARTTIEADYLRDFFSTMTGMQGEFYAPTWSADMDMIGTATVGTATITLAGTDVQELWQDDTVHTRIAIFLIDDRKIFKSISGVVVDTGNSVMTVSENWGYSFTSDDVLQICWLPLCRFATDQLTIEWLADGKAQVQLSIQTLEEKALDLT